MKTSPPQGAVDWTEAHARLARASAAIQASSELGPEQARVVMEARARALARVPVASNVAHQTLEVVTFALSRERYAIEATYVRAILRTTDLTSVPGMPDFVMGITNLRGEILAVVDLRRLFGIVESGLTDLARLIVVGAEHCEFGILADAVDEVVTLRGGRILPPPASTGGDGTHLRGVTEQGLIVLDGAALLADERLYVDQVDDANV